MYGTNIYCTVDRMSSSTTEIHALVVFVVVYFYIEQIYLVILYVTINTAAFLTRQLFRIYIHIGRNVGMSRNLAFFEVF